MSEDNKPSKYIFIDTSVFFDVLQSDSSSQTLDALTKLLDQGKITIILPEVILMEIRKQFVIFKKELIEKLERQLSIEIILNVTDKEKTGGKNKGKKSTNSDLIDSLTKTHRASLLKTVKDFYQGIENRLEDVFKHKNTKMIKLDNSIILKGIERSLLNRAPSEKLTGKNENQHLRDIDCMAFESVLNYINSKIVVNASDSISILVKDTDYIQEDGETLKDQIVKDLSKFKKNKITYSESIDLILPRKVKNQMKKDKGETGSLSGEGQKLAESKFNIQN